MEPARRRNIATTTSFIPNRRHSASRLFLSQRIRRSTVNTSLIHVHYPWQTLVGQSSPHLDTLPVQRVTFKSLLSYRLSLRGPRIRVRAVSSSPSSGATFRPKAPSAGTLDAENPTCTRTKPTKVFTRKNMRSGNRSALCFAKKKKPSTGLH